MYPLTADYKQPIIDFIHLLRSVEGLEVRTNGMSTQVFGEYDLLTSTVTRAIKETFENHPEVMVVSKLFNADLSTDPDI